MEKILKIIGTFFLVKCYKGNDDEMRKENNDIIRLIVKSLRGELTPEEEALFLSWKSRSKANEEMYGRLEREYEEHTEYELFKQFDARREWSAVAKGIHGRRSVRRFYRVAVAASLLVLGVASYLLFPSGQKVPQRLAAVTPAGEYSFSKKASLILPGGDTLQITPVTMDTIMKQLPFVSNNGEALVYHDTPATDTLVYNTLEIPRGGAYSLQLADGTKVMLNSESRLRFPQSFTGDSREVFLDGEGYFQVAKDAGKPFIVHCSDYKVRVLGTTFNISAYPGDDVSMTTLVEGRVNVERGDTRVLLTPGVMASVTRSGISTREVEVESYISWTKDQFSFSEERLVDLLKKISRWYDVDFVFDDPEIEEYKFSGFIPRYENITAVLQIMEQAANVTFKTIDNKKIKVYDSH